MRTPKPPLDPIPARLKRTQSQPPTANYVYETLARTATGSPVRRVLTGGHGTITGKRGYGTATLPASAHPSGTDCCGTC